MRNFLEKSNTMFRLAICEKISGRVFAILSPIIILIMNQVIMIPVSIILVLLLGANITNNPNIFPVFLGIQTGVCILATYIIIRVKEKRGFKSIGLGFSNSSFKEYGIGFALGIIMIGIIAIGIIIFGNGKIEFNRNMNLGFIFTFLLVIISWVIQGASEEIMLRGYMMPVLGAKTTPLIGIIVSSVIFSALHLGNPGITPLSLINLSLFGFFAALYALYRGNLWGICALHSAWNFAQGNLFGFLVSGTEHSSTSIIKTVVNEGNLINGGSFGPEGGILTTIVLLVGIGILCFLSNKKRLV